MAAYITDTTSDPAKLSLRLARLEAMALLGGTIAQATSGLWIEHLGYAAPYWFIFACQLSTFLYITFSLPESHHDLPNSDITCYSCKDLQLLAGVVLKKRFVNGRLKVLLLLLTTALVLLPVGVVNQLVILYAKDFPLCWRADFIGYFLGTLFFGRAVGAVLGMKFLKWLNWRDYSITQLGCVFLMALLVMIGLSTSTLAMFLGSYNISIVNPDKITRYRTTFNNLLELEFHAHKMKLDLNLIPNRNDPNNLLDTIILFLVSLGYSVRIG